MVLMRLIPAIRRVVNQRRNLNPLVRLHRLQGEIGSGRVIAGSFLTRLVSGLVCLCSALRCNFRYQYARPEYKVGVDDVSMAL